MPVTLETLDAKLDKILALMTTPSTPPVEEEVRVMCGIALIPGEGVAVRTETAPWFYDRQTVTFRVTVNQPHTITSCNWGIAPLRLPPGTEHAIVLDSKVFGTGERDSEYAAVVNGKEYRGAVRWGLINIPIEKAPWFKATEPGPKPAAVASVRDWSILHDWPSSWPPVAEDGRMPQLPEARDVETLVLYARHGYEWDGTPMRGPVSLGFAGNEVEAVLDLTDEAYRASRYGKAGVVRDLACYGLLTKRIKVPYDLSPGADLQNEPMTGVAYPSLEALLAREVDMFGGGDAGPGGKP